MLVLFETAAGFALFKVLDEGKLKSPDDLANEFSTADKASNVYAIPCYNDLCLQCQAKALLSLR